MKEVKPSKKPLAIYYAIVLLVLLVLNFVLVPWLSERQIKEVDYGTFMTMTEEKNIGRVDIESNQIVFTDKDESQVYKTGLMSDPGLTERLYDAGAQFSSEIVEQGSPLVSFLVWFVLPILLFSFIGNQMNKKLMEKAGGANSMMFGGVGKSNAKVYVQSTHGIRFADVAGEDEAKENLQEIVNYLHDPKQYEEIGASMPKGILLVGPPGTGKTMLAKAVAGESNVPFFSISGSEFVEMFVGMGASKVRDLFKQAKEKAPCIVFIDEIDAIGQKRNSGNIGGNDEREQTLNQLLTEMDGFEGNTGVIILAATNRPDSLDPALTRPGRFDRRVPVELPDLKGREEILKVHAKKVKIAPGVDFNTVARMASGASGAELANIVNEAALRAVRAGRKSVTESDLEESIEVVIAGYQKKNSILTDKEKCIVAYHEIGHALVAAKQSNSAPVQKITIIPRTSGALGYTMQVDEGNHYLMNQEELENKIATHRRPRRRGSGVPLHHHRCFQRYRAGHQACPRHDHPLRHEQRFRHGGAGNGEQPVSGRRHLAGLLGPDPARDRPEGGGAGQGPARKGGADPHRQPRKAGRAGPVPLPEGDHHRRRVHGYPQPPGTGPRRRMIDPKALPKGGAFLLLLISFVEKGQSQAAF